MENDGPAVLVFSLDRDVQVFASPKDAAGYMEAIDVRDGEYPALFTLDGRIVQATTADDHVHLSVTDQRDGAALRRWLADYGWQVTPETSTADLVAIAEALLRAEWENRWPKRPRWLSRKLHGDGPQQVTT